MDREEPWFEGPGPDAEFRARLAAGKFCLQQCAETGEYVFYPRVLCPGSGSPDLRWVEASGDGVIYSVSVIHQRPERGGDYAIALVDLAEGPRMMSRVVGVAPEDVAIGMRVKAKIVESDGEPLVVFERA